MTAPESPDEVTPQRITIKDNFQQLAKKGFYLYLPPVQAAIVFIICLIKISAAPDAGVTQRELWIFIMNILILFAVLCPLIYLFFPKWFQNTWLYILSLIILNILLISMTEDAESLLPGPGINEAAMGVMLNWGIPFFLLPITGGIKAVINTSRKWKEEDQKKGVENIEIPEAFGE